MRCRRIVEAHGDQLPPADCNADRLLATQPLLPGTHVLKVHRSGFARAARADYTPGNRHRQGLRLVASGVICLERK
jgi:hypothetical protein